MTDALVAAESAAREAAPFRTEATDRTGVIRAVVDELGLPVRVDLQSGWRRKVGAETLAAAVTEACAAATAAYGEEWMREVEKRGLGDRLRRLYEEAEAAPVESSLPFTDVLAAADRVFAVLDAEPEPGPATGEAALGRLRFTISPGGSVSCVAEPGWVARQSDEDLAETLNRVLAEARAQWKDRVMM